MRQRKIKGLTKESITKLGVITKETLIESKNKLVVEIGAGKGMFITKLAANNKDINYVAFEKNINVCLRIIEKANELELTNLKVVLDDSKNLLNYFKDESVDLIYLNFSDPWPKSKHHKRRLTYPNFLKIYQKILKPNGQIQFRTDHYNLFVDSIEYLKDYFNLIEANFNYKSDENFTEYELKRIEQGNLYQLKGVRK